MVDSNPKLADGGVDVIENSSTALRLRVRWFSIPIAAAGAALSAIPASLALSTFSANTAASLLIGALWILMLAVFLFNANRLSVDRNQISASTGPIPWPPGTTKQCMPTTSVSEISCGMETLKGPRYSLTLTGGGGAISRSLDGISTGPSSMMAANLVAEWLVRNVDPSVKIVVIPPPDR